MRAARWLGGAALLGVVAVSPAVRAGELVVGSAALEIDDKGKITKAAKAAAGKEIEAHPGDESWTVHLWARIDQAAVGPLYLEFYRERHGKQLVAHREEFPDFGGDKYLAMSVELYRADGFRAGETLDMAFVQNVGGRDAVKAKTKITFVASTVKVKETVDDEPEALDDEQDEHDDLGDDEPDDGASSAHAADGSVEGPPPVTPEGNKGCSVGNVAPDVAPSPWYWLLALVAVPRRRRPAARS